MADSGMKMDKRGYWTNNKKGQKINMYEFMDLSGKRVSNVIFDTYYNNTVDCQIAKAFDLDLGFEVSNDVPEILKDKYTDLVTKHLKETSSPASLHDKYKFTIYGEDGVGTELFKLTEDNPYLDDLLKQNDINLNSVINASGCNFMTSISVPQLLTGNIFNAETTTSIWNRATKQNGGVSNNASVYNPDILSNYAWNEMGYNNMNLSFGYQKYKNMELIGNRIRVPCNGADHFTLGGVNNYILYNPGWATGKPTNVPIYLRKK